MHLFVEIQYDSREFTLTRTSIEQKIEVVACIDPTIDVSDPTLDLLWGQGDDIVALEYAYSIIPETREFPDYFGEIQLCVLDTLTVKNIAPNKWSYSCTYKFDINTGTGGIGYDAGVSSDVLPYVKFGFTLGGGTVHISKSNRVIRQDGVGVAIPAFDAPPDSWGAIGLMPDGIQGADIPDSTFRLQITAYYRPSFINMDFASMVADLIDGQGQGSYNNAIYLGRAAGEVQLISASGSGTVVDIIPITYDFSIKKNISGKPDDGFPNLTMLGHNLLDYTFHKKFDDKAKSIVLHPEVRTIHETATPVDYSALQIPGAV